MAGPRLGLDGVPFAPPRQLTAGVVAHNEELHLRGAVRSLLDQRLPDGVRWKEIWIVASGCTDATVAIAQSLAAEEPRVRVVEEADRGGKARALGEVFRRATGDALVLLNSDARAAPNAVARLVETAVGKVAPFAVMARPVLPPGSTGPLDAMLRSMWDLHHEFHQELLADGTGSHLSDELLLVSLPTVPPVPDGIINDGAYLAVWLAQHHGNGWYAPGAQVAIQVPSTVPDHLRQRRRIHVGNHQIAEALGVRPASIPQQLFVRPGPTVRLLRRTLARPNGVRRFLQLTVWELAASVLAAWDRLPPRADHVRWQRIRPAPHGTAPGVAGPTRAVPPAPASPTERRVSSLLRVARGFDAGLPLDRLRELLPEDGPDSVRELEEWLAQRPELARLEGPRVFASGAPPSTDRGREAREQAYLRYAEWLWNGPLSFARDLVRCVGVSGSVAFGEPRAGDDLDLFVVTRSNALWWFLARAYLALRRVGPGPPGALRPTVCLNYVLEDELAAREFSVRRDLLFAREALSVRILWGDDYYRGLLSEASWMRAELPRLYDARCRTPGRIAPVPASSLVRGLNGAVYPLLASYLHLGGLFRNARADRRGRTQARFRTETGRRRLAFASHRFEGLRLLYEDVAPVPRSEEGRAGAPGVPAAR